MVLIQAAWDSRSRQPRRKAWSSRAARGRACRRSGSAPGRRGDVPYTERITPPRSAHQDVIQTKVYVPAEPASPGRFATGSYALRAPRQRKRTRPRQRSDRYRAGENQSRPKGLRPLGTAVSAENVELVRCAYLDAAPLSDGAYVAADAE